ncbi:hypothetical protein PF007_g32588 [Phytophthora fragariae]|uniref:Uncharacterized protein n=1 Tax=Phytophthora fragariae TaxID=53985 RepID=A0A6A3PKB9_9STRA|nr:hypothetical protein PF007_g32588 [Phytophthora fragariae]
MIPLRVECAEAYMLRNDSALDDIRKILSSGNRGRKLMNQHDFTENLGLEPEYESTSEFTAHEFALLKQLRAEQLASKETKWEQCEVVATILYNAAVRQLDNPSLQIRNHGYHAISRRLGSIDMQLTQPTLKTLVKAACILTVKTRRSMTKKI